MKGEEFKRGDLVILTDDAQRSFPAMVSKGSHVGVVVRVTSSKRIRIRRHGVANDDYWGPRLWQLANQPPKDPGSSEWVAQTEKLNAEAESLTPDNLRAYYVCSMANWGCVLGEVEAIRNILLKMELEAATKDALVARLVEQLTEVIAAFHSIAHPSMSLFACPTERCRAVKKLLAEIAPTPSAGKDATR